MIRRAPREIVLWAPTGSARKKIREGSALEVQLRRAGWREISQGADHLANGGPQLAHFGTSETARQAREALGVLPPERWIKDWGYVLCAALDEAERSRGQVAARASSALDIVIAATEAVKATTEAITTWMLRAGWTAGKPALEPTRDRQAASEDLVRLLLDVTTTFMRKGAIHLAAPEALDARVKAVRGDPSARARASAILDELAREFPADVPAHQPLRDAIQRVRADFLGGSNVPDKDDEEVPS